jgi:hypothetical protein
VSTSIPVTNEDLHQLPRLNRDHAMNVLTGVSEISMDLTAHPGFELGEEPSPSEPGPVGPATPAVHVGPDAAAAAMGAI